MIRSWRSRNLDSVSRLRLVVAAFVVVGCNRPTQPSPAPSPGGTPDTLKAAAGSTGKLVGAATQSGLLGNTQYRGVLDREFNYITAEYEMKWDAIEHTRGVNNFSAGDTLVAHADMQGMQVKGHALIWHGSVPPWASALLASDFRAAFEDHIRSVASHYAGRVRAWDVVNEAVADDGSGLRDTVFRQKLGDTYIADAFRLAHDADPHALLFYNDYNGEGLSAKSNRIYDLVKNLLAQGVPIHGVGLQMHVSANSRPSDANIAANLRRLADLGLLVNISEMDVKISSVSGTLASRLDAQKSAYHAIVGLCVMEPRCDGVTFWGITDAHSWISNSGTDGPLLFDATYAAKPAYTGVIDAFRGR